MLYRMSRLELKWKWMPLGSPLLARGGGAKLGIAKSWLGFGAGCYLSWMLGVAREWGLVVQEREARRALISNEARDAASIGTSCSWPCSQPLPLASSSRMAQHVS